MHLVIDVGNTNIVCGVFNAAPQDYRLKCTFRIGTNLDITTDELGVAMRNMLYFNNIDAHGITHAIFASVVPPINHNITKMMVLYFKKNIIELNRDKLPAVDIRYNTPEDVGMDRIINVRAAAKLYGVPAVIADYGTATTIDIIDAENTYIGGLIIPGVAVSLRALIEKTSKLHKVELTMPSGIIGTSTKESIQNGVYFLNRLGVEQIIRDIKTEYFPENTVHVIATGGLSKFIASESKVITNIETNLSIIGLKICLDDLLERG